MTAIDGGRLDRSYFARATTEVARDLLGCLLVSDREGERTSGRVVEAEAYLGPDDPASHAFTRRTGRVTAMWGPPGVAYVYRSYGIHAMLNVVTEPEGVSGAVLLRALEPVDGVAAMRRRRGVEAERLLCSGPGRLCQALGISVEDHGLDLVTSTEVWFEGGDRPGGVAAGARIGITRGTDRAWRFFVTDSRHVSAHRRGSLLGRGAE
jgi:DNA-3-methyladenine glycosylase